MTSEKIRVFINGFGRIGRLAARILLENRQFELVGINDLYPFEQMAYLLKYDSIYGTLPYKIKVQEEILFIDKHRVKLFCEANPKKLNIRALNIDIVLQCSGMFLTKESNLPLLENGAKKVIVSTPPSDNMPIYIYGVNHEYYKGESIISNSSCSANAIVPIFKIIDKYFEIQSAMMTMYHSYTSYQNILDNAHYSKDIRRTRCATQNIIPLMSSAAEATACFFPHLEKRLYAKSIRVPVPSTTLYELHLNIEHSTTVDEVNLVFKKEINNSKSKVLDSTVFFSSSKEYVKSPYSAVINLPLTDVVGKLLKISAWQDNEYGYACRLVDMAGVVGKK